MRTTTTPNEPVHTSRSTAVNLRRAIYARSVAAHACGVPSITRASQRASRGYVDAHEQATNRNAMGTLLRQLRVERQPLRTGDDQSY